VTARRYFQRGDVVYMDFPFPADPSREPPIKKYAVVLQGGDYWRYHSVLLVALVTSDPPVTDWPHMVPVKVEEFRFGGLHSWIDCCDLYRVRRVILEEGREVGRLPKAVLDQVDEALLVGTGTVDGTTLIEVVPPEPASDET
jgi:mRNA-degrading endonuclease toxin of MazEF toxin-antitoxin module